MDDETIWSLAREFFPKLLQCPFSGRVGRHVALRDTSRSELKDDKHVEDLELGCDCNHEITSDNRIGVDSLLDRLRNWHKDAAALVLDDDIRERVKSTLLNIDYAIAHLKAARSDKAQKLKSLG